MYFPIEGSVQKSYIERRGKTLYTHMGERGGDIMITRKHLLLAIAATCLLTTFVLTVAPIKSAVYDPSLDENHDGKIDGKDIALPALIYGTAGDPTVPVTIANYTVYERTVNAVVPSLGWYYFYNTTIGFRKVTLTEFQTTGVYHLTVVIAWNINGAAGTTGWNIDQVDVYPNQNWGKTYDVAGDTVVMSVYNNESFSVPIRIGIYLTT